MSNEEHEFILDAIEFIAIYGQRFLPLYHFNWKTGSWTFKTNTFQETLLNETDGETRTSFCNGALKTLQVINDSMITQKIIDCNTIDDAHHFDKYAFYLEAAKNIGNLLPKFPSQCTAPKDINLDHVIFRV